MVLALLLAILCVGQGSGSFWTQDRNGDQCEATIKDVILEDRASNVDNTPSRLFASWLSQECEMRAGPEYIIRKYTFFENSTFLLIRHHYAEESCSVATHTVTARGSIKLLSASLLTPGATEARFILDTVHVIPLNRQVAHKFGHRLNVTCSPQPRWRPYVSHLVYEQSAYQRGSPSWHGPSYNSLQGHQQSRSPRGVDCLEPLGIEFGELRLLRVQKKASSSRSDHRPRVELFLGSLPGNPHVKWSHRSTSLQATSLLRSDTTSGCPICSSIARGTECSPPLLHEVAALPALLGGSWISLGCESVEGGLWIRRQLQIYSGDKLWVGRWDYHVDPRCTTFLYAISAAGSYEQRPGRSRRHGEFGRTLEKYYEAVEQQEKELEEEEEEEEEERMEERLQPRKYRRSLDLAVEGHPSNLESRKKLQIDPLGEAEEVRSLSPRSRRTRRSLAEWMSPELARVIVQMYTSKQPQLENMLPTAEEIHEAIGGAEEAQKVNEETTRVKSDLETKVEDENLIGASTLKKEAGRQQREARPDWSKTNSSSRRRRRRRRRRSLDEIVYRHLMQNTQPSMAESFAAMLRGNQKQEEITTRRPSLGFAPSGSTELDLHVAESLLIPGELAVAARCGGQKNRPLASWPRNCIPKAITAPSTVTLRAKVGVSWAGQYILMLGPRDDQLWDSPLQQCGPTPSYNPELRVHLRRSVGLKYGLFSSAASQRFSWYYLLLQQLILGCLTLFAVSGVPLFFVY